MCSVARDHMFRRFFLFVLTFVAMHEPRRTFLLDIKETQIRQKNEHIFYDKGYTAKKCHMNCKWRENFRWKICYLGAAQTQKINNIQSILLLPECYGSFHFFALFYIVNEIMMWSTTYRVYSLTCAREIYL